MIKHSSSNPLYVDLHGNAKLSTAQIKVICNRLAVAPYQAIN